MLPASSMVNFCIEDLVSQICSVPDCASFSKSMESHSVISELLTLPKIHSGRCYTACLIESPFSKVGTPVRRISVRLLFGVIGLVAVATGIASSLLSLAMPIDWPAEGQGEKNRVVSGVNKPLGILENYRNLNFLENHGKLCSLIDFL